MECRASKRALMNGRRGPCLLTSSFIGEICRSASRKPKRTPQPASLDFTSDDTFPMSARPASLPFNAPMTLPMSATPFAPSARWLRRPPLDLGVGQCLGR